MKTPSTTSLTVLTLISLNISFNTLASDAKSDNALLTSCKQQIESSIDGVSQIDTKQIRSRRGVFTAKFKVSANNERFMLKCTSHNGNPVELICSGTAACETLQES